MTCALILLNFFRDEMGGNQQCCNRSFYRRTSHNSQNAVQERHPGTVKFHIHPSGEIPPVPVEDGESFHLAKAEKVFNWNKKTT